MKRLFVLVTMLLTLLLAPPTFSADLKEAARADLSGDEAEAVRWYRLSAEQGNADAQASLGFMYGTGTGVAQDDVLAYMWRWSSIAAAQGHDMAGDYRDFLKKTMSRADVAAAQKLASECVKRNDKGC